MKKSSVRLGFTLIELLTVIAIIAVIAAIIFPVFSRTQEAGRATSCLSNLRQLGLAIQLYTQDYDDTFPMSRAPDAQHPPTGCTSSPNDNFVESGLWGSSIDWRRLIVPYVKNRKVYECPSNGYTWNKNGYSAETGIGGDESNSYYPTSEHLPASYAMNGNFFHEAIPPCWYGESRVRPRHLSEIDSPSQLIEVLESRLSFPDLGAWAWSTPPSEFGWDKAIQTHNGMSNFLFVDAHVKRMKLRQTCIDKLWADRYPAQLEGCTNISALGSDYN